MLVPPGSAIRPAAKNADPEEAASGQWETVQLRGCWRAGQTAGGSRNFASYATNPCFPLAVPEGGGPRCVRITLQQHCPDGECHPIGFHVFQARRSVCWGQGLGAASRGGGPSEDGCPRGWQVAARRPGRDRSGMLAMPARRLQDAFLGSTEATMPRGPQLRRPLVHWPGSGQLRHEVTSPQEAHWCHGTDQSHGSSHPKAS